MDSGLLLRLLEMQYSVLYASGSKEELTFVCKSAAESSERLVYRQRFPAEFCAGCGHSLSMAEKSKF